MLDQADNTYIFLCTIEDLLGSVWSFACNGVDVKKLSWICSTGNAYISINFSSSPSTPAVPSPRHWRTRHFFRRLYASWNYTDLIQAPPVRVYTCKDVYVRVRARVCATLDHWLSSTVVPNFTSCSPSSLFVDSRSPLLRYISLTSIECLDRFSRHLSSSMGICQ